MIFVLAELSILSAIRKSTGKTSLSPAFFLRSRAVSSRSFSTRLLPVGMAVGLQERVAHGPADEQLIAPGGAGFRSTPSLVETFAPPITATSGGLGLASRVSMISSSFSMREADALACPRRTAGGRPASRPRRDGRCRRRHSRKHRPAKPSCFAKSASPFFSPLLNRTFSRTTTPARLQGLAGRLRPRGRRCRRPWSRACRAIGCSLIATLSRRNGLSASAVAGGPAQVAHQDQACAVSPGAIIQGRQGGLDPAVVGDLAVLVCGTLKSTRIRAFLPFRSRSRIVCLGMGIGSRMPSSGPPHRFVDDRKRGFRPRVSARPTSTTDVHLSQAGRASRSTRRCGWSSPTRCRTRR